MLYKSVYVMIASLLGVTIATPTGLTKPDIEKRQCLGQGQRCNVRKCARLYLINSRRHKDP